MEKEILNRYLPSDLELKFYSHSSNTFKNYIKALMDDVNNILDNYDVISDEDYIRILSRFIQVKTDEEMCEKTIYDSWSPIGGYDYHTELYYDDIVKNESIITKNDMIDLYNFVNDTDYKCLTSLKTKMKYNYYMSDGWGKDRTEMITPTRVDIIILTSEMLDRNKIYIKKEIQELVDSKTIFVIASNKMEIERKDIPNDTEEFHEFGIDKKSTEYKKAYVKFLKSKISKEELFKAIKSCLMDIRKYFYKSNEDWESFRETCMYNEMEELYTKKFRYQRTWK